jgi:hypothetical protein
LTGSPSHERQLGLAVRQFQTLGALAVLLESNRAVVEDGVVNQLAIYPLEHAVERE